MTCLVWLGRIVIALLCMGGALQVAHAQAKLPLSPAQEQWVHIHPVITAGMHAQGWMPFEGRHQGHPQGLAFDTLNEAAARLGVRVQVRWYSDWGALLDDACAGRLDVVLSVALTPERTRCLVFSRPYLESPVAVIARLGDPRVRDRDDLAGLNVITERDFAAHAAARSRYPRARHTTAEDTGVALQAVAAGRADVYLGNPHAAARLIEQLGLSGLGLIRPTDLPLDTLHFAVPNANAPLAEALDIAMAAVPEVRTRAIQARWLPALRWQSSGVTLSDEEQAALAAPLRMGAANDWAPITFSDPRSGPSGLAFEYVRRLRALGADPQLDLASWHTLQAGAARGEYDLLMGVSADTPAIRGWAISEPFLTVPNVIVTHSLGDVVIDVGDLKGRRIAVSDPQRLGPRLLASAPGATLVPVADAAAGLDAVQRGAAAAYVGNLAVIDYQLRDRAGGRLQIAAPAGIDDRLVLAAAPAHAAVVEAFDRMLLSLSPREREAIRGDWLAVEYRSGIAWRRVLNWAVPIGLVVLTAAGVFGIGHLRLRQEVAQRRQAEKRLSEVGANLPAVVYQAVRQENGTIELPFIAGDVASLFGITAEAAMANERDLFERIHPDDRDALTAAVERAMAVHAPIDVQFRALSPQGWRWIQSRSQPQPTPTAASVWTGYWIDVTATREQAQALQAAKAEAERAAAAKSEFLATMSHEIRTPMSGVIGTMEMLAHTPLDETQRGMLALMDDSAQMLRQILDDILDLSKIEAGALTLDPTPVALRELIGQVPQLLMPQANAKGLTLEVHVDPELAPCHFVDGLRVRQVLFNLLSNALKFTARGGVTVQLTASPVERAHQAITLRVRDTGIGISQAQQAKLFAPFTQADGSTARHYGGTGLGLAICRRLVELMDGTIALQSQPDQGTEVTVRLALPVCEPDLQHAHESNSASPDWSGARILVAEDHPTKQILMRWRLEQLGITADIVDDGVQALERLHARDYDLLITDCLMPNMDGYALSRAVREWEQRDARPRLPIVALSANVLSEDVQRCFEAGMDDFIAKPVDLVTFRAVLTRWLPAAAAPHPEPPPATATPPQDHAPPGAARWRDIVAQRFGSPAVADDILRTLAQSLDEDAAALRLAQEQHDATTVVQRLHRVIGGLDVLNASDWSQRTRALMDAIRADGLQQHAAALTDHVEGLLALRAQLLPDRGT